MAIVGQLAQSTNLFSLGPRWVVELKQVQRRQEIGRRLFEASAGRRAPVQNDGQELIQKVNSSYKRIVRVHKRANLRGGGESTLACTAEIRFSSSSPPTGARRPRSYTRLSVVRPIGAKVRIIVALICGSGAPPPPQSPPTFQGPRVTSSRLERWMWAQIELRPTWLIRWGGGGGGGGIGFCALARNQMSKSSGKGGTSAPAHSPLGTGGELEIGYDYKLIWRSAHFVRRRGHGNNLAGPTQDGGEDCRSCASRAEAELNERRFASLALSCPLSGQRGHEFSTKLARRPAATANLVQSGLPWGW